MPYFCTLDRCKLYYEVKGGGEPIIFMHGWTSSHNAFFQQVPFFVSKGYQVITYDHRGHFCSDREAKTACGLTIDRLAADLHELIGYFGFQKVNICGWSMGTSVLLNYIRLYGTSRLKSVSFIDMTPKLLTDEEWKLGQCGSFTLEDCAKFTADLSADFNKAVTPFIALTQPAFESTESEKFRLKLAGTYSNSPHCMIPLWISMASKDYRDVLPKVDVPAFLAYGGDGQLYFPAHGEYMRDHISGPATLDIFPGYGHTLFMDSYEKFNADYYHFLSSLNE